jgi:hypothetical protein
MVKDGAQLYTMEGIAAGLIMLLTTYLVLGSTSVYTPGDTHLSDMQLEQVGSDILKIMDTPVNLTSSLAQNRSDLRVWLDASDDVARQRFRDSFMNTYLNNPHIVTNATSFGSARIQIRATVWYRNQSSGAVQSYILYDPPGDTGNPSAEGPGVRVTRLVHLDARPSGVDAATKNAMRAGPQEVLVEVLMWQV